MSDLKFLLKVSRPRFWIYIFGPYIVGLITGISNKHDLLDPLYLLLGIYFLFPANLLIYGVNDIFDYETDKINPKKANYETLVTPEKRSLLWIAMLVTNVPFLAIFWLTNFAAVAAGLAFLFFSIFYSAPPIRAKAKPFLDSAFNILYIMPGVFSYALSSGAMPPVRAIIAGGLWTAAMHAYSAIPDIDADREAGLSTVATILGAAATHIFCTACYLGAATLAFPYLTWLAAALGAVYVTLMSLSMAMAKTRGVFAVYKAFPVVNAVSGFVMFWFIAYPKII